MLRIHRFTIATRRDRAVRERARPWPSAQDLRSPDTIAAGQPAAPETQDYRTPDAVEPVEPTSDLRAPDNRFGQPTGGPAPARVRIVEIPSSGFGWGDAGIGAAGMLALVMLAWASAWPGRITVAGGASPPRHADTPINASREGGGPIGAAASARREGSPRAPARRPTRRGSLRTSDRRR